MKAEYELKKRTSANLQDAYKYYKYGNDHSPLVETSRIRGIIFDIKRMSLHDGPGIRTTVFLKGCNMKCQWCHNPESLSKNPELMFNLEKCINCRQCERICQRNVHIFFDSRHMIDREKCDICGKCAEICPIKAIEVCGKTVSVKEVMEIVKRDKIFYDVSGGGVTISGGEPLVQKDFTYGLLYEAKSSGINTIVDTNGKWKWKDIIAMLPFIDGFRYDLKMMDSKLHNLYTGVDNRLILENLKKLAENEKQITIAIPLIKDINDSEDNIKSTILFLKTLKKIPKVQILPYHSLYKSKSEKLGKSYTKFAAPANIEKIKTAFKEEGINIYDNYT
jgi:pyruvate formate lyase activating enzyme